MKKGEKHEQNENDDQDGPEIPRGATRPDGLSFNIHLEIRNDHERDDHERGNQNPGDEWGEVVQQFLEAEKIPGRFGRVGSKQRIRELLERCVPEKRRNHHSDHQHLKRNGFAEQKMRIGH